MIALKKSQKIYLACGATDMRKSSNALSVLVRTAFKLDPLDNAMFVFCNRARDILKILVWGGDGFWLHTKNLEKGRFEWPSACHNEKVMTLTYRELEILIGGTLLASKFKRVDILDLNSAA